MYCSYQFNARIQIVTEMCCSHQYLSVNTKKSLPRPQTAHKIQNIAGMNANISETIKDRKLDFRIRLSSLVHSASLLHEDATLTLTPTNRPNLWRQQFLC